MYVDNGCRFGFYVNRNSWSNGKYAAVIAIDGVEEGLMAEGNSPYFTRTILRIIQRLEKYGKDMFI